RAAVSPRSASCARRRIRNTACRLMRSTACRRIRPCVGTHGSKGMGRRFLGEGEVTYASGQETGAGAAARRLVALPALLLGALLVAASLGASVTAADANGKSPR